MPIKKLKIDTIIRRASIIAAALAVLFFAWSSISRDIAASVAYRGLDSRAPESRQLADWIVDTAPDDPYTHAAAARFYERSFEPDDAERALRRYEKATSLNPNNFNFWILLGKARDRSGDSEGAESAYQRAADLAPNYAAVNWAFGNALIRHGKADEGFQKVAFAVGSDPRYAGPAASLALQFFDADADQVRRALGSNSDTNAAIAEVLGSQKKYADSLDAWLRVSPEDRSGRLAAVGQKLLAASIEAHQARIGAAVQASLQPDDTTRAAVGQLTNGGFEGGVKLRNAGPFDWQIAEGNEPQIGLSETVKRTGKYSLWLTFDSFESAAFRTVSQRFAAVPGAAYEFSGFYRAEIKSKAEFKWEIVDASTGAQIGVTERLMINGDWTTMRSRFIAPQSTDDIIIRLIRTGCTGAACPATGKLWFDDLMVSAL